MSEKSESRRVTNSTISIRSLQQNQNNVSTSKSLGNLREGLISLGSIEIPTIGRINKYIILNFLKSIFFDFFKGKIKDLNIRYDSNKTRP